MVLKVGPEKDHHALAIDGASSLSSDDAGVLYALADAVKQCRLEDIGRLRDTISRTPSIDSTDKTVSRFLRQVRAREAALSALSRSNPPSAALPNQMHRPPEGMRDIAPVLRADVQKGLLLSLAWTISQLKQFAVEPTKDLIQFGKDHIARLKPISELALTLEVLHRCGIDLPATCQASDYIWEELENGRTLIRLLLARNDFLPVCAVYASMERLGYHDEAVRRVLATVAGMDLAEALPLQPWAALALRHNLATLGLPTPPRPMSLYLTSRPEPWAISAELGYAVTHETFYLTDFGHGLNDGADELLVAYLRLWIPYWTSIFLTAKDNDLVGELAMCDACVSDSWPTSANLSPLLNLLDAQEQDGSIAGPDGAGGYLRNPKDNPERVEFLGHYHTTLVACMACALTLVLPDASSKKSE